MEDKHLTKELSAITQDWLKANKVAVNGSYLKEAITTHPDYPALTSLTDFLESGGMAYDAVQADASYIHEFNYPLLAHIKKPGNEYLHLIKDATIWDKEKSITANWSGIALYTAKGATWHNEENKTAENKAKKNKYTSAAFIIVGLILLGTSIFIYPAAPINIFGILSFIGLAVSLAALGTELGYQSKVVKQVCGTVGNGGCEKVLGSKYAKGFGGITPADASVLYFATQFLLYLISCFYNPIIIGLITIAFSGVVVATWSIYTQAIKVKEWCALCLCIVGVLVGQIVIATYLQFSELVILVPNTQLLFSLAMFIITVLLLTLAYLPIKQLIVTNTKNNQEVALFKKWKADASLFLTQLEKEPSCDNTIWQNDLIIGKAEAPIMITVACNPYCGPCARAHEELDQILKMFQGKVKVQLRFICKASDDNHITTIALKSMLEQAAILKTNNDLHEMFIDWFKWMDINKWSKKWDKITTKDIKEQLFNHENWIKQNNITYTPTFFINGKKLPSRYNLKSIKKLIPQLAQ